MKNRLSIMFFLLFACSIFIVLTPEKASAAVTGSGVESDPYIVENATDLTTALKNGDGSTSTLYIQLNNDITYTDSDSFIIYSNVVINGLKNNTAGSYYKMLKTGTSTTTSTAGFYVNASGYDVTYENLSFGDSSYTYYQTYYGIILNYNAQVDLTIRNVDYFGSNGGQPLCNYNGNTTFTFEGTNNFNVASGSNSQEFMEGANLTFAADSTTNIEQTSSGNTAFIYNSTSTDSTQTTTINVESNAYVNITTNKRYFVYDRNYVNLNLADSAVFLYSASSYGFNPANGTGTASTYTIGNNATLSLTGAGRVGSSGSATMAINATTPAEISFENTSGTGLFSSTSTLTPTTMDAYLWDYTVGGVTTKKSAATTSTSLTDSAFATNVAKVVYYPKSILSFDATSTVADGTSDTKATSNLDITNLNASSSYSLTNVEYKIFSTSPLSDDADLSTDSNQSIITNASNADYAGETTANSVSLTEVLAGTYTVFVRGTAISSSGRLTQTTDWVSQVVTVDRSTLVVSIPIEMTFSIIDNAEFTSADSYTVTNQSNYPATMGIQSVTSVPGITLVNDVNNTTATNPLYLALRDTSDASSEIPFISDGSTTNSFSMNGFGGEDTFNLVGQYGGTVSYTSVQDIQYTLTVVIGS
ncbi:hypothetical protein ACYSNU_16610 [Enterococcus sp. LJL120]